MVRATASATGPAVHAMLQSTHHFPDEELNALFPICQRPAMVLLNELWKASERNKQIGCQR
eukprot:623718-Amphidinium_carterae.1